MSLQHSPRIVTDGLVLCLDAANRESYPGSGLVWTDLAGSNNGTLTGGPTFSSANGGSVVFDGVNDYIDCGGSSVFNFSNVAISCWFKKLHSFGYKGLVDKGRDGYGAWSLNVDEYANTATFKIKISGTNRAITALSSYGNNSWTNIVGVFDGLNLMIFQNGILSNSAQYSGSMGTNLVSVRVGAANDGLYYSGNISQVLAYNRALTPAEIQQNYNATKGRYNL